MFQLKVSLHLELVSGLQLLSQLLVALIDSLQGFSLVSILSAQELLLAFLELGDFSFLLRKLIFSGVEIKGVGAQLLSVIHSCVSSGTHHVLRFGHEVNVVVTVVMVGWCMSLELRKFGLGEWGPAVVLELGLNSAEQGDDEETGLISHCNKLNN